MGGDDKLTAVEAGRVLQKLLQLQLELGGEAVFRLVQQIQAPLPDLPGKVQKGALPVGPAGDILHHLLLHIARAGQALGGHRLFQLVQILQGAQLHLGIAFVRVFLQQFPALPVDILVHAAKVQQIVKHVVAGDDPAVGADLPGEGRGGLHGT